MLRMTFQLLVICLLSTVASANSDDDITEPIRRLRHCVNALERQSENPAQAPEDAGKTCLEIGQECTVAINRRIVAGANEATTHVLIEATTDMTLAAVRAEYCDKLTARAEFFDDQIRTAQQELKAKIAAPFRRAGLRGDRLELATLAKQRGHAILGVGGVPVTVPQIKRARLLFVAIPSDNGHWKVYRFAFSGDTASKQTHETYAVRPDSSKFR